MPPRLLVQLFLKSTTIGSLLVFSTVKTPFHVHAVRGGLPVLGFSTLSETYNVGASPFIYLTTKLSITDISLFLSPNEARRLLGSCLSYWISWCPGMCVRELIFHELYHAAIIRQAKRLGHKNIDTTLKYYSHIQENQ